MYSFFYGWHRFWLLNIFNREEEIHRRTCKGSYKITYHRASCWRIRW